MIQLESHDGRISLPILRRMPLTACLAFFVFAGGVAARAAAGITGQVTDPHGAALPGVRVMATDESGRNACDTQTDAEGFFTCASISAGRYTVAADAAQFVTVETAIVVVPGSPREVNLQLRSLASQQQAITVVAEAVPILTPDPSTQVVDHDDALDANPGRPGAPISIPGLPIETASGGIKAPQYFAPGVAGDHGEPIGQFLPVGGFLYPNNLPANAHGNGYSDPNILIPTVLSGVETDAGAFNVREGDHSVDLAATYDLRPRFDPFAQMTADDRDLDFAGGWSSRNPSLNAWLALEVSVGNGFLERLEHRHQYKLNGSREFKTGRHDVSLFGIGYYGFSRVPGLIPIDVPVPDDTIDYRQLDRTHTFLAVVSDTWQTSSSGQILLSGFLRDYDLTLQSNFGDGLIQQREARTVVGGEAAYLTRLGHGLSLLAGVDLRRDAPRNLDLKHLNDEGLFQLVTANNFTFDFAEPFASLAGSLSRYVRFNVGVRQEEIGIQNEDILAPANSFNKPASFTLPKASVTFLPPDGTPLPSLSLSGGEAFHTDDPRIGTDSGVPRPPNLTTTSRACTAVLKKAVGNTLLRLALVRVANSEETANIDPDTGLQMYVGPSLNHALTASVGRAFRSGSIQASFSRADARDRITGQPVPEAPRLIWDAAGHWDRLPLGLRARGEFEYVGGKPLGDGFTGGPVREVRAAIVRSFRRSFGEGSSNSLGVNFLAASGYTGQTLETLALAAGSSPFERIVGVPLKSYVSLTFTHNFGR